MGVSCTMKYNEHASHGINFILIVSLLFGQSYTINIFNVFETSNNYNSFYEGKIIL